MCGARRGRNRPGAEVWWQVSASPCREKSECAAAGACRGVAWSCLCTNGMCTHPSTSTHCRLFLASSSLPSRILACPLTCTPTQVSCGSEHTLALAGAWGAAASHVFGWGSNRYGQLGMGVENEPEPGNPQALSVVHEPRFASYILPVCV